MGTNSRTNAGLAKLALEHYDAELGELCRRDTELNRLRATYAYLAQEADEDFNPLQPTGEDYVPLHRRPGPVRDAYLAYRDRLKQIAESTTADQLLAELEQRTEEAKLISADLTNAVAAVRAADEAIQDAADDRDDAERTHGRDSAERAVVADRLESAKAHYAEAKAEWQRIDDAHTAALELAEAAHAAYVEASRDA